MRRLFSFGLPVIALVAIGAVSGCGGGTKTVTASGTESTATASDQSTATTVSTQGAATPSSSGDPAAEAEAATSCLRGPRAEVKQLTPAQGNYGIDAFVTEGRNRNHIAMIFTPSPAAAETASKFLASEGSIPRIVGNNVIAFFEAPTPANQQATENCFSQATGSA
jgi:hypothetical protein